MTNVAIIGAGMGGLVAALLLAAAGCAVTVYEAAATPGGKLRAVTVGDAQIDAGPTVFTLLPIFESIFAQAGLIFSEHVTLEKLDRLARHAWEGGATLDLSADARRNADAIGDFAGAAAAKGYTAFARRSEKIYELLDPHFMQVPQPGLPGLFRRAGPGLSRISPFASLWPVLGKYFTDPRLRQLFGRYATYCGASPFTAPATLMLIAHAELCGVYRVKNGMFELARALEACAKSFGARFIYNTPVSEILVDNSKASGVRIGRDKVAADAVIANSDVAALDAGLFGDAAKQAVADMMRNAAPSFSALTWAIRGAASGLPLLYHNVFFSNNYPAEFTALAAQQLPPDPTVYVCAQGSQKYFSLINAPAGTTPSPQEAQRCLNAMLGKLHKCGMELAISEMSVTGPREFAEKFPATGGALYGRALRSWRDPFARPGARTKLPGLFLAGGSVHPGPGLPMAALSGRHAAACVFNRHVKPDGYAWWYIDALSDDGTQALTLIAFIGSVFSPYYSWAEKKNPENFCAINVALYRPGSGSWAMTERGMKSLKRSENDLTIGKTTLRWDGNVLTAEIDEICAPWPKRLRGRITLHAKALQPEIFCLDAGQRHRWQPIAPVARVEVDFDNPKTCWSGNGYFDRNDGDVPLQQDFSSWHWSRAASQNGAKILYDVKRKDGSQHMLALDVNAAGNAKSFDPPPLLVLPRTAWGIERMSRADLNAEIRQLRRFESAPFYARSLLATQIAGEKLNCIHESLDLRRFAAPWVRLLLPFRMPRRG